MSIISSKHDFTKKRIRILLSDKTLKCKNMKLLSNKLTKQFLRLDTFQNNVLAFDHSLIFLFSVFPSFLLDSDDFSLICIPFLSDPVSSMIKCQITNVKWTNEFLHFCQY